VANTNAVLDYSIENPIFSPQSSGPLPWDAPNRLLLWGWAPLDKNWFPHFAQRIIGQTNLELLFDYHTGFPFSATTETGYIFGQPDGFRFPTYSTLNVGLERIFTFHRFLWAGRVAMVNVMNELDSNVVNSDADSTKFMTFGRGQARAVNFRLRLLGRK
jgi:hypothetical protein